MSKTEEKPSNSYYVWKVMYGMAPHCNMFWKIRNPDCRIIINALKHMNIQPLTDKQLCNICLIKEDLKEDTPNSAKVVTFCCRSLFCENCLLKAVEKEEKCPVCDQIF